MIDLNNTSLTRKLMSPKRRFLTAMLGGKPDRIPVGNVVSIATQDLMQRTDAWFPKAHGDPETMARLAAAGYDVLGYDTVMPVFSVTQEAAALGCEVNWGQPDEMPTVRSHPFSGVSTFSLPVEWFETPSIRVVLDAIGLLRKNFGSRVVIVGKVMGPWTLSYHLMGIEEFLIAAKVEPDRARKSMETLMEVTMQFAQAQVEAGADIICVADHATGGMVSPRMYRDLLFPLHQEIFGAIGAPTVLHCCGNTTDRIKYFAETGVDCYHFESHVNLNSAVADAKGKMTLIGNINNPDLLLSGTCDEVYAACKQAIESGVQILAPECAVPLNTPTENLQVLSQAAYELDSPI